MTTTNYCILCEEMGRKLKAAEDRLKELSDYLNMCGVLRQEPSKHRIESIIEGKS